MGFFEAGMMICFGASWPAAILKTIQAKNPAGKSAIFLFLVILGYISGILNKFDKNDLDWVTWLYVLNLAMVATDLILVLYYRRRNRAAGAGLPCCKS